LLLHYIHKNIGGIESEALYSLLIIIQDIVKVM
jgi:hypothetical protein